MELIIIFSLIFLVSLIATSCGFFKYVYFFSVGYGFSIFAIGFTLLIYYKEEISLLTFLYCVFFIVFGLRLGGYLIVREIKSQAYQKILKTISERKISLKHKVIIQVSVVVLFITMTSPIVFILYNRTHDNFTIFLSLVISIVGLFIESLADYQKSEIKKKDPKMFASEGLYKLVRCPNYLGEVTIWVGVFIAGITSYNSFIQWFIAILGLIGIIFVMFSGCRRIEINQDKNYSENTKFQEYIKKTPILFPFVPIYSVKKYKWLVA